ncbi:Olfactory receptor 7A10 [Sciurus carolinensis]|uniref:Olfactory receptor 7A10 n=1 Tax=Sciurus carolinensis TaxID=30640 RepID=A0AA41N4U0_SCICA|nr:Olfactory receptor 7A10 [Sciurus carolinensis]
MEPQNDTQILELFLLGLSEDPELQPFIFGLFLSMYLVTVLGNLLIILATISDTHLHTPMYFFLSNLTFVDIFFTTTTVPKMLVNIETKCKTIAYEGCIIQIYYFTLLVGLDNFLLTVMAYDRFVAICHPLYYMIIMKPQIVSSIRKISSAHGKYKAFSTCASHISVVSLFYCTLLGLYLSSAETQNGLPSATASVMYSVVTPMLNPFTYSLRNKDIKSALKTLLGTDVKASVS